MATLKPGSIVSLLIGMALLGACGPPPRTRPREVTPEIVDSRPVFPTEVAAAPGGPREGTIEVVNSRPVLPADATAAPRPTLAPPTLAPAPALARPVAPPASAPDTPPPSTPAPVASAVIGATGGARVNLRTGPSTGAPVVATLAEGTPVELLDEPVPAEGRSWQKIRSGDHEGWVVAVVVQPR